ncbi:MAG: hypothetical protein KJO29_12005 [Bacteroidia bacterium]|nr:hypothetical protein [Bacteroidia bacterium]
MDAKEKNIKIKRRVWLITALFSISIFILNYLFPLMPGDDFLYSLKIPDDDYIGNRPISSVKDYFDSQVNHYSNYNYRVTPHAILQIIMLLPTWVFDIFNTLVFLVIPLCLLRPFKTGKDQRPVLYLFILLFIWVFHFDLGRSYFWTSGSLNYSWLLIPQLYLAGSIFQYVREGRKSFNLLDYLCVILVAFSNENVVLSLFVVVFLIILDQMIKRKLPDRNLIVIAAVLLIGGITMLSSPALTLRLSKDGFNYESFDERILEYGKRTIYYLFCYSTVLLFFLAGRKSVTQNARAQIMLFLVLLLSTVTMFFAPLFEPRSAIFGFMICIMLVLSMINLDNFKWSWLWILVIISSFLIVDRYPLFRKLNTRYNINKVILEENRGSRDTVYLERYCTSSKYQCLICDDVTDDPEYMDNEPLAAFYNIHKVSLKPDYALFAKWQGFSDMIVDYLNANNLESIIYGNALNDRIVLEQIFLRKNDAGMDVVCELNTNTVPDDYIMIIRGSKKGINRYRILDLLPIRIRLYFLDYLEYQGRMISHENKGYYFNHIFNPTEYTYYVVSLYSMNNHRPEGNPVKIEAPY